MSRASVQGFQPDRLRQILATRRLSQAQIALMLDVWPGTVSKWKAGDQAPEPATLERLATIANVTAEWFTRPPLAKLSPPKFRSNASAHVAARAMLEGRLEWAQEIAIALAEFVDYPELNIPNYEFSLPEQITTEDIERAASECREKWRLGKGPIQDLALAAESSGIIVVREETGVAQIEGLSAWSNILNRPVVLLSSDKDNGYRSRFDLAHEIGHLVLHTGIANPNERERYKLLEKQAHQFAGALLLPAENFVPEVRLPVSLDDLLLLKRRWGVSVAAIILRLKALKMIDDNEYEILFKRRSARWGAKSEPGDADRKPEQPRLLKRTVELLAQQNVMPLEAIPRHIGISAFDIEMLTNLPKGYFSRGNNVVELAQLRKSLGAAQTTSIDDKGKVVPFKPDSTTER